MSKFIDVKNLNVRDYVTTWECTCSEFGKQSVMAIDDLEYLSTVDIKEMEHGHWYAPEDSYLVCSNCRRYPNVINNSKNKLTIYNYCPFCGAKMSKNLD